MHGWQRLTEFTGTFTVIKQKNMIPTLAKIDHLHIYVSNRISAQAWYARVLGLVQVPELEFWSANGGPLTIANTTGNIHLALFERPPERCRSTVAFAVDAPDFLAWQTHLSDMLKQEIKATDHDVSWSLYFKDPDGNPYEITSYAYQELAVLLALPLRQ